MSILRERLCGQLRVLRAERGLSQENVAAMLNMSHSGYAKLERGETEIGLARVEELAKVFQVNIVTLLQLDIPNVNISGTLQSSGNIASPNATLHITAHTHDGLLEKTMRRMLLLEQQVRDAGFEPIG